MGLVAGSAANLICKAAALAAMVGPQPQGCTGRARAERGISSLMMVATVKTPPTSKSN